MSDEHLQETTVDQRVVHEGYLTFRVDTVVDHEGKQHRREILEHPGAIAVLALDGEELLLVRQFRAAVGQTLLEIPAGTRDRHEDGSFEDPDRTAPRELAEETGHQAAEWRKLGIFYTAPGFATEEMHLYLARGLTAIPDYAGPDADEHLDVVRLPWRQAVQLAVEGEIRDAKTLVALLWLDRLQRNDELDAVAQRPEPREALEPS